MTRYHIHLLDFGFINCIYGRKLCKMMENKMMSYSSHLILKKLINYIYFVSNTALCGLRDSKKVIVLENYLIETRLFLIETGYFYM